jgi:mutator protein MutT
MKLEYCPECAAPLIKQDDTHYTCENNHPYYNNPRATVAVIFIKDDKLLFSQRAIEPNKGRYDFPGGFLEYDEDPYAACVREIEEETSLAIEAADLHLLTAYSEEYLPNVSITDLIFIVKKWHGAITPQDDSAALEWKSIDFLENKLFVPYYKDLRSKLEQYVQNNR